MFNHPKKTLVKYFKENLSYDSFYYDFFYQVNIEKILQTT